MRQVISILIAVFCGISLGAQALTGSGDSAAGPLETVPPSLHSVSAATEGSLSAAFSEPMLAPGVTTPGNYAVSGLGAGTLTATPANVSGTGPYTLSWTSGEMLDGASVTVTATGLQDAVGNLIDPAHNNASCAGIGIAPVFSNLTATPAQAAKGDTVTITFMASEELLSDSEVEVNGHAATRSGSGKAVDYTYEYTVLESDPLGMAAVAVSGFDLAGNPGAVSGNGILEITASETAVPLYAWPAGFALLAAGLFLLRNRKRRLGAALFMVAALLASSVAFAQAPTVSNVTFSQGPNGTTGTQVDIYYDLVAPNGPCAITVSLSEDGGADGYVHPVTSVTGDIAGVNTGTGKHIVWDIQADYPEKNMPNARLRVTADDGAVLSQYYRDNDIDTWGKDGDTQMLVSPVAPYTATRGGDCNDADADINPGVEEICSNLIDDNCDARTDEGCQRTLTYTAGDNGSISGISPQTVNYGQSGTPVMAVPDTGYHFAQWSDGNTDNPRTDTDVTTDITVTATFAIDRYDITCNVVGNGTCTANPAAVDHGNTSDIAVTPEAGWHIVSVVDSEEGPKSGSYTTTPVTANRTVTATFAINTYDITCNVVGNGTCTANPATVDHGGTSDITFAPDTGWYLLSVVDSVEGPKCNAYTTSPVVENRTVTATFSSDRVVMLPGCIPIELVWVPSGSFQMGRYPGEADSYSREDPQHGVTLAYGFWMGKHEITQQQWLAVQGSWPGTAPSSSYGLGNTYPAYYISWNDAKNFITTLNAYIVSSGQGPLTVRLPSEAEWEYACRGGTATRFYFGDSTGCAADCTDCAAGVLPGNRSDYMWYCGNNSPNGSKPVGGKTANAFGLYDMSGNVYEWCEDDYLGSYTGAPADGSAWINSPRASNRLIRGGGWNNIAGYCRSAYRCSYAPGNRYGNFGFRLAADNRPVLTSFAINSGAATTTDPVVTLDNTAVNGPVDYMASEASDFAGATWQPYAAAPSFTLSAGTGGVKTVYFKVRNAYGESAPVSDTINLTERTILLQGGVPLELVWAPSGSYQMGRYPGEADSYTNEDPQHWVALAYGFWMGKYEITQQQWLAVQGSWPGTAPSSSYGLGNTYPAYYISWNDAKNFITTLNAYIVSSGQGPLTVRLPSEAEWEYACRGGTATRFYFGDSTGCAADCTDCAAGVLPGNRSDYMWYCGNNSPNGSKPVGGKTANAFGLYDMSGNVYEWCEDDYLGSYTGAPADGSAWINSPRASNRLIRGGGWNNIAGYCRSAYRCSYAPGNRYGNFGFRLAADNRPVLTSFAINSGAATTTDPVVTLDNTAVNGPVDYMASEASDFAGSTWQPYAAAPSFTLSAGTGGVKTVYFKVRNAGGESAPVSDTINLTERTILLPGGVPLELVWAPSGSYQMGRYPGEVDSYTNEDPQHWVALAYGF
ncbi:MAG TPA: SUMF1/EgtB/PvdO family nonheme iron enzyme, partial [Candidatus Hydrogenedentes bacterium]|nr:SUMF1/EgtB/PvdO family nonheme iron enzyme [Candidatus Hydrogenedentota bacterium]